ncbi:MAG: hypothetical protein J6L98_02010 [Bacteroidales bacterium]|nr:hypothetical protein [Bacteroidales bacterium]MBP3269430.1 hypothetical protein [Bacteroidales bacterium]
MKDLITKAEGSLLGPLEAVFVAIGEELGNFLDKSIDRLFEAINKDEK